MRLDNERPSDNIEDRRGEGGGFGWPDGSSGGGRRINIPMGGGRGGFSFSTIILLGIAYLALKFLFGIDLLGGGGGIPGGGGSLNPTEIQLPRSPTDVAQQAPTPDNVPGTQVETDAGRDFVSRVLGSTERVWTQVFEKNLGRQYPAPKLVMFSGFVQSGCGTAQSAMGPFYCPLDQKVYIDLSFYQDMRNKLGAPGDFAQAYVIAHEVGHHIQTVFGIADKVTKARMRVSQEEGNALQVRMELQADCLAGIWAAEADASAKILEDGDIEEALNAAAAIGDDRLQKRSQGYVVPEAFTHGSSAQRVRWFKQGLQAKSLSECDTFATDNL